MLESLEAFREEVQGLFDRLPDEVAVVLHPRAWALTLAHPWLPLARTVAAPASRRYFAGWFTEADIHVLSPPALERRASTVPGSREALLLSPLHEYSHLVIGINNPDLPPRSRSPPSGATCAGRGCARARPCGCPARRPTSAPRS